KGGNISTPAQPCTTACLVSLTVSMIEQQPVPGIMRDGSIPAATNSSSRFKRSSNDSEFASLLVPNTASPQFCDSNHLQCATNRLPSGARSALNGVTTGASTPRMRSVIAPHFFLFNSSFNLFVNSYFSLLALLPKQKKPPRHSCARRLSVDSLDLC